MADEKDREIQYLRREIEALKKRNSELIEVAINNYSKGWTAGSVAFANRLIEFAQIWANIEPDKEKGGEDGL